MGILTVKAPVFALPRLERFIADLKDARARRAVYHSVLAELQHMDDRDLSDIGISRLVIKDVAQKAAYGSV